MLFSFLVPQASGRQTQDGKDGLDVALPLSKSTSQPVQREVEWIQVEWIFNSFHCFGII